MAFENAFVRVLEVHVPPGSIEPRHRHPHGLSVYLSDWQAKVTVDGKEAQVNQRKAGTFTWSDAVIHTVQNVGPSEGHVLRIELSSSSRADLRRTLPTTTKPMPLILASDALSRSNQTLKTDAVTASSASAMV